MSYEVIDHTADFGIRVYGNQLIDLYQNAALALTEIVFEDTDPAIPTEALQRLDIRLSGLDWSDLMINWLREIHYLIFGNRCRPFHIAITRLAPHVLEARIRHSPLDVERVPIANEIKAVTYHQLEVKQAAAQWEATIIFDV